MGSFDVPSAFQKPPVNEQAKSFPVAEKFLQNLLIKWQQYDRPDDVAFVQQRIANLKDGNQYLALNFMEDMKGNLESYTTNINEWREAIFNISSQTFSKDKLMNGEKLYKFFDEEFENRDGNILDEINSNPDAYSRKEKNELKLKNERWFNASTMISQEEFRLACDVIEEEIVDQLDWQRSHMKTIDAIQQNKKSNASDGENLEYYRKKYSETIIRINELRVVRDSLYKLHFKK